MSEIWIHRLINNHLSCIDFYLLSVNRNQCMTDNYCNDTRIFIIMVALNFFISCTIHDETHDNKGNSPRK